MSSIDEVFKPLFKPSTEVIRKGCHLSNTLHEWKQQWVEYTPNGKQKWQCVKCREVVYTFNNIKDSVPKP